MPISCIDGMVLLHLLLELGPLYLILMIRVTLPGNKLRWLEARSIGLLDGLASHDDILANVRLIRFAYLALCKVWAFFLTLRLEAPMIMSIMQRRHYLDLTFEYRAHLRVRFYNFVVLCYIIY